MFEKIKKTILQYVDCDPESITPETEFLKDLKMNSYDIITMVGELEEEFGITIESEDLKDIVTIDDFAKYIAAKL
ncbi:MAG: acyl carrier protein [Clostridia bacterium]|nr:acyl carrier protein [Clostridia bacterium]